MSELQASQSMSKKNGATSLDSKCMDNEELFSHPSHPHMLTLLQHESDDGLSGEKIKYCNGCNEVMCFPGYACRCHECSFFSFYLHKSCAELPKKILHPLHPHPLTSSLTRYNGDDDLICDGCRDLCSYGFKFRCSWSCGFNLDAKCASKQDQEYHHTFKELTLFRFYHKHVLKLCNIANIRSSGFPYCRCCWQVIRNGSSAYCCLQCKFFIHESCTEIPKEVEHPFHPQHILVTKIMDDPRECAACLLSIGIEPDFEVDDSIAGIGISCKECDFNLHVSCANPNRWASPLIHNCHEHNMYYFIVKDRYRCSFKCNKCHEECLDDEPIYRCVECDFNLHFKCIPISSDVMITQKHLHPLTLIDSVKEDNPLIQYLLDSNDEVDYSVDYYCDVCETPGNPRHHAYCCKECIYIAHVECIISEEQEGLASKEKGRKHTIHYFFHQHQLKLRFFFEMHHSCCWCYEGIYGPGYCCIDCNFFIHDFCCMEISPQLQNPLHPHPLLPKNNFAYDGTTRMCRACKELIFKSKPILKVFDYATLTLSCEKCNFDLHSVCATWTMKLYLKHECHNHNLYFPFDLIMKNEDSELLEDNVLYCNKCHDTGGYFYCCRECDINFHFECIPLPRVVKHKSHKHPLTLTYSPKFNYREFCDICKTGYWIAGHPIFICKECKYFSFVHIECMISKDDTAVEVLKYLNPRPEKEQRSSTEDHCGQPELDRGNGNGSEKMETLALELEALEEKHTNKKDTPPKIPSNLNPRQGTEPKKEQKMSSTEEEEAAPSMSKKNGASTSLDSKCMDNEELFSHPSLPDHKLTLLQHEESKEDESENGLSKEKIKYCIGCLEVMCFPGYACESAKPKFYLHKSCAELPPEILHPLHPHPLTLIIDFENIKVLICDGCRDLYFCGFNFSCSWCDFNLHLKCASKQDQDQYHQTSKELTLYRFYHKHPLKLCNVPKLFETTECSICCCCCRQIISTGTSAYCCIECELFIHESCTEIPMEIHHPFHPQHLLLAQDVARNAYSRYSSCAACKRLIHGIKIDCNECFFQLHVSCANPNRGASPLKHNCHEHNMYYFVKDDTTESSVDDSDTKGSFECNKCHEKCLDDEAFYRCVECDFNLHFKCIPIPSGVMITQKHHHPLTLIDSVKDDNPLIQYLMDSNDKVDYSMDYYCDVCETPGNPRHHAYCCKECIYIAHVECIISKVNIFVLLGQHFNGDSVKFESYTWIEPKKEQNNISDDE